MNRRDEILASANERVEQAARAAAQEAREAFTIEDTNGFMKYLTSKTLLDRYKIHPEHFWAQLDEVREDDHKGEFWEKLSETQAKRRHREATETVKERRERIKKETGAHNDQSDRWRSKSRGRSHEAPDNRQPGSY